ncbi:HNH endonuclease [Paenilisteria weihenstephanensis]|uniref:HNH endonuclease n=1 Tax=Listeria weihenstephanensis TaxID=1006155 RepID=UPI0004BC8BF9|nr:HNH endonuclease [Listeria weihenstephanensis]
MNVFLGEIEAQSESMVASYHDMIEAMEGLMRAVNEFAFDRELQGKTYDSAKQYFAATYRPLAQGMICLCEELIRQNQAFPRQFQADVATTDVIEDEIRNQIRQLDGQIQDIEKLSNNVVGMALITPIFVDLKRKLQEKLEALYRFDAETATSFDRAMDLTANIVRGLAEIDSDKAFQPKTGTFNMMGLNMAWRSALQKQWTAREEAIAKLAKDNETARLIKAAENGPLPVIPDGNVAGFVTKDGKLDGQATYDNAKWQQAHVLAGMKNAIFLIDMVAPIFDIYRWKTGLDPITQEKLSPFEQNEAAAFTALTFVPFGKLGKVAKAIKASTRTDEFKFLFENVDNIRKANTFKKMNIADFTDEIMKTKPMNSRAPEKWINKGGTIEIDALGNWKYTNKNDISVVYKNGFPDFIPYKHPNVDNVPIEIAQPKNYPKDYEAANKGAGLSKISKPPVNDIKKPPEGYTWHHMEDGKTMMLVEKDIHNEFKHMGGQSIVNGKGK